MAKHILTESDIDTLENRCDTEISDICDSCGYDIKALKLANWLYILGEIQRRIFRPMPGILYDTEHGVNTGYKLIIDNMISVYGLYCRLCDKYGLVKRKRHFFQFSGIARNTIYAFDNYDAEASQKLFAFRKMIERDAEESLVNSAISDRGNPVKYIAILNHEHAWNNEQRREDDSPRQRISIADLPKIDLSHNSALPPADDSDDID